MHRDDPSASLAVLIVCLLLKVPAVMLQKAPRRIDMWRDPRDPGHERVEPNGNWSKCPESFPISVSRILQAGPDL